MTGAGLEARLGHVFADRDLLSQALTHRSFGAPHNERLEFLGDSVLNCRVASLLYRHFSNLPEGDLSRIRANLVNQTTLAQVANDLAIGDQLRLGDGELKTGGAFRASILADAFEATIGAIFLDAGFDAAGQVVDRLFLPLVLADESPIQGKDAKTQLQELLQAGHEPLPEYHVARVEGAHHRQNFVVECRVASRKLATSGEGTSRRIAEQRAAQSMLEAIRVPARQN
jgi:ribonuclease III